MIYTRLENVVQDTILRYPMLYEHDNYYSSRLCVLNHLFLTTSNGYTWSNDGYLIKIGDFYNFYNCEWINDRWSVSDSPPYNYKEPIDVTFATRVFNNRARSNAWRPYPAFESAAISRIPDNTKRDWLLGASNIVSTTIEWYSNKINKDHYMEYSSDPESIRNRKIDNLKNILDRICDLYSNSAYNY